MGPEIAAVMSPTRFFFLSSFFTIESQLQAGDGGGKLTVNGPFSSDQFFV